MNQPIAISIVNDRVGVGFGSSASASSGNGVTINAGASDSVHLRGLTIEGLGSGTNGILFTTGGNLEIENCIIRFSLLRNLYLAQHIEQRLGVEFDCFQ